MTQSDRGSGTRVNRQGSAHRLSALRERKTTERRSFKSCYEAGNRMIDIGRYVDAVRLYRLAGRAAGAGTPPDDESRLHFNTAFALAKLGRHFASARAYRRCLELTPRDADAWFNLGNAYREAGALRRACRAYCEAVSLEPSDHEIWNNLGNVRAALGETSAAAEAYRSVLDLRPDYHPSWNNLGIARQSLGDHRSAVACYDRAIDLQGGTDLLYFFNRAIALLSVGRTEDAVRDIGRWVSVSPFQDAGSPGSPSPGTRPPDWLGFLQSLAPSRARREV